AGRRGIVTTALEHPATEECCRLLERAGHRVRRVAPQADGGVAADDVIAALDETTALVTVIHAQNEIGTLQPVGEIFHAARRRGAWTHADAAQSLGKVPVDVDALGADLLTVAGHKLYAPKGVGALYVRRGVALPPLLAGAGQEHGMRPGTENVAFIVALGAACRIAAQKLDRDAVRIGALAGQLLHRLQRAVPGLVLTGRPEQRLPNTLNLLFPGVSGRALLEACPNVLASTGSACHAGSEEPSAVLLALGIGREAALGAVRLSLGRATTAADVEAAADHLAAAWRRLRSAAAPAAAPRFSGALS
ncbi:cysteine desulfurase family protein, partial [Rhodoplanes roseus]